MPLAGGMMIRPSCCKVVTLRRVGGADHIAGFIAGASTTGHCAAKIAAVAKSSARPCASRAIMSAVVGITKIAAASRVSRMCPMRCSDAASNSSRSTDASANACTSKGLTKRWAEAVMIGVTATPSSRNRRMTSNALMIATPPQSTTTTRRGGQLRLKGASDISGADSMHMGCRKRGEG